VIALGMYAVSYRRHFLRIAERTEEAAARHIPGSARLGLMLDRFLLRTPYRKACFRFVRSTLLRSEPHRLVLTGIAGLALVLASQALMEAFEGTKSLRRAALTPSALSIPFILGFLIIAGMRLVFEIPVELRANWIFQLMLDRDRQESGPLAGRVILLAVLPWILAISFPVYLYLEGITIASLHTLLVVTWTMLLTKIVLVRFRKLPFTCTLPVFKQHSIVIVLSFCFGYLIYAVSIPEFESTALLEPLRLLSLLPVVSVAWYIPRYLAKSTIDIEKRLIFEESPTQTVEALRLSD
jgi:hypothetical protein